MKEILEISRVSMHRDPFSKKHRWRYSKSDYHIVDNKWPRNFILIALLRFKGKSINDAFAYYCTLVPDYFQKHFWRDIKEGTFSYNNYLIDITQSGIIQVSFRKSKPNYQRVYYLLDNKTGKKIPWDNSFDESFKLQIQMLFGRYQKISVLKKVSPLSSKEFYENRSKERKLKREQLKKQKDELKDVFKKKLL